MHLKKLCAVFLTASVLANGITPSAKGEPLALDIPAQLGSVTSSLRTNAKQLILIQDAHDSIQAQKNISAIIHHLVDQGVKTVYEEGYQGVVPVDRYFGEFSESGKKRAAEYALRQMDIGGAEYARVVRSDFELIGADDFQLHFENVQAYAEALQVEGRITSQLQEWLEVNKAAFEKSGGKRAGQWLKVWRHYQAGKMTADTYWKRMYEFSKRMKAGEVTGHWLLRALAGAAPIDQEKMTALSAADILEFESEWENSLIKSLIQPGHQFLWRFEEYLNYCQKIARLQLTLAEYQRYLEMKKNINLSALADLIFQVIPAPFVLALGWSNEIKKAERFYEIALERDRVAEQSLIAFAASRETSAVMVYGGFHTEAILQAARKRGIAVSVVRPLIKEISQAEKKHYVQRMSSQMSRSISGFGRAHFSTNAAKAWRRQLISAAGVTAGRSEVRGLPDDLIAAIDHALKTGEDLPRDVRLKIQRHFMENISVQAESLGLIEKKSGSSGGIDFPKLAKYKLYSMSELVEVPPQTLKAWILGETVIARKAPPPLTRYYATQLAVLMRAPDSFANWVFDRRSAASAPKNIPYYKTVAEQIGVPEGLYAGFVSRQILALVFEPTDSGLFDYVQEIPTSDWDNLIGSKDPANSRAARLYRFRINLGNVVERLKELDPEHVVSASGFAISGGWLPGFYKEWIAREMNDEIPISYREARELVFSVLRREVPAQSEAGDLARFRILFGDKKIKLSEVKALFGGVQNDSPGSVRPAAASSASSKNGIPQPVPGKDLTFPLSLTDLNAFPRVQTIPQAWWDDLGNEGHKSSQESAAFQLNRVFLQNLKNFVYRFSKDGSGTLLKERYVTKEEDGVATAAFVKFVGHFISPRMLNYLVFGIGTKGRPAEKGRINRQMAIGLARFFTQFVDEAKSWSDEKLLGFFLTNESFTTEQMNLIFKEGRQIKAASDESALPVRPKRQIVERPARERFVWPPLEDTIGWEALQPEIHALSADLLAQASGLSSENKPLQIKFNQFFLDNAWRVALRKKYGASPVRLRNAFVEGMRKSERTGVGIDDRTLAWYLTRLSSVSNSNPDTARITREDAEKLASFLLHPEVPGTHEYVLRTLLGDDPKNPKISDEQLSFIFLPKKGVRSELRSGNIQTMVEMRVSSADLDDRDFADELVVLKKDKGASLQLSIEGPVESPEIYQLLTKLGARFVGISIISTRRTTWYASRSRGWLLRRGGGFVYEGKGSLFAAYDEAQKLDLKQVQRGRKLIRFNEVTRLIFAQFLTTYLILRSA